MLIQRPPSSSLTSTRIKTTMRSLVQSFATRISRSISRTKCFVIETVMEKLSPNQVEFVFPLRKNKKKTIAFGASFRFHYNWCSSSHVQPVPATMLDRYYYDATWDTIIPVEPVEDRQDRSNLSGYLEWLEEKDCSGDGHHTTNSHETYMDEIDKRADAFIAKCHEKFILEKQESHRRRLQELIAI